MKANRRPTTAVGSNSERACLYRLAAQDAARVDDQGHAADLSDTAAQFEDWAAEDEDAAVA